MKKRFYSMTANRLKFCLLLMCIAWVAFPLSLLAMPQDGQKYDKIEILSASGEKTTLNLSSNPSFTFDGTTVSITAGETKMEYTARDIARVYFVSSIPNGISEATAGNLSITYNGSEVIVNGAAAGKTLRCYSLSGILIRTAVTDAKGYASLSLADLPSNIVIVKIEGKTLKLSTK